MKAWVCCAAAILVWAATARPSVADSEADWRRLAIEARIIVTGTVIQNPTLLERPERRAPKLFVRSDGRTGARIPPMSEYVEGSVTRVRVDSIHKADGTVSASMTILLYSSSPYVRIEKETSYLFFLQSPIMIAGRPSGTPSWEELNGTTYRDPATGSETPFLPGSAYQLMTGWQGTSVTGFVRSSDPSVAGILNEVRATQHLEPPVVSVTHVGTCSGQGCTAVFTALAEDPEGDPVTFAWSGCASGTSASVTCSSIGAGELTARVAVTDPALAQTQETDRAVVYPAAFEIGAWSDCNSPALWTCTNNSPTGCSRAGTRSRSVSASGWTLNSGEAATAPVDTESCTLTTPGFIAAYSSQYDANWTCTGSGATGCRKNRLSYAPSSYAATGPEPAVPAPVIYTTGYIATWAVGAWGGCDPSCGPGTQWRSVTPSSWKPTAPDAGAPPASQGCTYGSCTLTCYDYGLYRTWSECYAEWPYCDTRYRDNGAGGLLTCRHGYR
jgi:hypothetical protein